MLLIIEYITMLNHYHHIIHLIHHIELVFACMMDDVYNTLQNLLSSSYLFMITIIIISIYDNQHHSHHSKYIISSLLLQYGFTALMYANKKGSEEIVRTLLECRADVNAQSNVRNQMMMMIIIIIIFVLVLTIMMMVNR